jgi:hypothetical protein
VKEIWEGTHIVLIGFKRPWQRTRQSMGRHTGWYISGAYAGDILRGCCLQIYYDCFAEEDSESLKVNSNREEDPLEFVIGSGDVLKGEKRSFWQPPGFQCLL